MTDYSELKRLAEVLHGAEWQLVDGDGFDADNRFVTSQRRIDDNKVAFAEINYGHPEAGMGEPFQSEQVTAGEFIAAANPAAVLALIAENERLKKFEDWFVRLETANNSLAESFRAERDQIKAENEALRRQIPSAEIVWCACGDGHAANSYGAGFMDANGGVCANCDAANQGVEPDLDAMRKDAERYRWLRSQHWNESDMAVACHPKKSVKLGFDCPSGERLDHAIDAAMGKGEQA